MKTSKTSRPQSKNALYAETQNPHWQLTMTTKQDKSEECFAVIATEALDISETIQF